MPKRGANGVRRRSRRFKLSRATKRLVCARTLADKKFAVFPSNGSSYAHARARVQTPNERCSQGTDGFIYTNRIRFFLKFFFILYESLFIVSARIFIAPLSLHYGDELIGKYPRVAELSGECASNKSDLNPCALRFKPCSGDSYIWKNQI